MAGFEGLTPEQASEVRSAIIATMRRERWNITAVEAAIRPILERANIQEPGVRAQVIARTETSAITSEHKIRVYRRMEQDRGRNFLYRDAGVNDHRRTKLSRWIQETIGAGKTLDQCIRIVEEGISLAKAGAFATTGALRGIPGQPIILPMNFQRRGFVAHFNDRDAIVRVVN